MDLSALPLAGGGTLNLLPELNSNGYLDVVVSDDSAVDYMKLTVIPEPVTLALLALGGVTLIKRRQKLNK